MPKRAPMPCRQSGCPATVAGGGYCETHQKLKYQRQDRNRLSPSKRGYDSKWRKIRQQVLSVDPLCRHCSVIGFMVNATEVDHIDGNSRNNNYQNLRPLCKSCHSARTMRDQVRVK